MNFKGREAREGGLEAEAETAAMAPSRPRRSSQLKIDIEGRAKYISVGPSFGGVWKKRKEMK